MYYVSIVYIVERICLMIYLMIYLMRIWVIVCNFLLFNNILVLVNFVYYNRCIKLFWELLIKSIFCCIIKLFVFFIKRKLIWFYCIIY